MKAMLLRQLGGLADNPTPLALVEWPEPTPGEGELLLQVLTCGVCHTELDEIEGRTPPPHLPVIPGHQVVGRVAALGPPMNSSPKPSDPPHDRNPLPSASYPGFQIGERVGVAWIFSACGRCPFCLSGQENLCPDFRATGRDAHGGYAEYMTVPAAFAHPIPATLSDVEAAPLLCAGAVGYRALRLCHLQDGQNLGLSGFGASNHLVLKAARYQYPHSQIFVFARSEKERAFALELGAVWAGDISETPPTLLHSIVDATPVWTPVVAMLKNLEPGGRLVINAIRKEDSDKAAWLGMDYASHLWLEREIKSVANVTRRDVREFLALAAAAGIRPEVEEFRLAEANRALSDLKARRIRGAKVLRIAW
ncbi:MAG: zinc-dependent alcohol dehydrogenase family protein [Chloroflexota bacterium]